MEACALVYSIRAAILTVADRQRRLDPQILSDSTLIRFRLIPNQAFVYVHAAMWIIGFEELRALTNSSAAEINPIELAQVYDCIWVFADLIQGDNALTVLSKDFRIWHKIAKKRAGMHTALKGNCGVLQLLAVESEN